MPEKEGIQDQFEGGPASAGYLNKVRDLAARNSSGRGMMRDSSGVHRRPVVVNDPPVNERQIELYDDHAAGDSPQAYNRPWDGSAYDTDLTGDTFEIVDVLSRFRGRGRSDTPTLEDDSGGLRGKHGSFGKVTLRNGQWEIDDMQPHAVLLTCFVDESGDFATGKTNVNVDGVIVIQPTEEALLMYDVGTVTIPTVANVWAWAGLDDQRVTAEWNDANEDTVARWEMAMKKCNP